MSSRDCFAHVASTLETHRWYTHRKGDGSSLLKLVGKRFSEKSYLLTKKEPAITNLRAAIAARCRSRKQNSDSWPRLRSLVRATSRMLDTRLPRRAECPTYCREMRKRDFV